jgi:hypothetical protein
MNELLTEVEQAKQLHCSTRLLRKLRARRVIPYVKLGRAIRYAPAAVARAIEKLTVKERI